MTREAVLNKETVIRLASTTKANRLKSLDAVRAYLAQMDKPCASCPKPKRATIPDTLYRTLLTSAVLATEQSQLMDLLEADRLFLPGVGVLERSSGS
jgi:hypothetical protein